MARNKKRVITLDEYLASDKKAIYGEKYKKSLDAAKGEDTDKLIDDLGLKTGKYSLKNAIKNNPWLKEGRPASKALGWLYKTVFKTPHTYKYNKKLLHAGGCFAFEYKNPKNKGKESLPFFDKFPLIISLGPIVTKSGIRNLGFNLHLVPPKIRIIIMCQIFELYKRNYRYQIFYKKEKPVTIKYKYVIKSLEKYGADFCVRMYIPARQNQIVLFPYKEWKNAIFIPSRAYDGIKANKLIQLWTKFIRAKKYSTSANVNWLTQVR